MATQFIRDKKLGLAYEVAFNWVLCEVETGKKELIIIQSASINDLMDIVLEPSCGDSIC